MLAEIVAIGTELLLGATVDTNSAWLARELGQLGVRISRVTLVGDAEAEIAEVVAGAASRAPLVICSGGLGPTGDDLTREGVARATGRPLELRPELLAQIEARFQAIKRPMTESNRRQAYVPAGARAIANPRGTAPAFLIEHGDSVIVALPGVPGEQRWLTQHALMPYLRDERGLRSVLLVRSVHLAGTSESAAGEAIAELMEADNPRVGITAKGAQYEVRIAALGQTQADAEALMAPVEALVRSRLARFITPAGRLADHIVTQLEAQNRTLALFDGHRRAPLSRAFGPALDSSAALRGALVQPHDGPVDAATAQQLARAGAAHVRQLWASDLAIGVQAADTAGAAGRETWIVLLGPDGEQTASRQLDLDIDEGWAIGGTMALDLLRRTLDRLASSDTREQA